MKANNEGYEKLILTAIQNLEKKVDALSILRVCKNRLDSDTLAVITAAAYNLFGERAAIRNIRLFDDNLIRGK
jgi:hypothetical protein